MDEGPSTSGAMDPTLRQRRNRESKTIRENASSSNVVFHAAMMEHEAMGNETAKKIHEKLMKDPDSMDDYWDFLRWKAQEPIRKLTPLQVFFH